jgi:hypothetical protein
MDVYTAGTFKTRVFARTLFGLHCRVRDHESHENHAAVRRFKNRKTFYNVIVIRKGPKDNLSINLHIIYETKDHTAVTKGLCLKKILFNYCSPIISGDQRTNRISLKKISFNSQYLFISRDHRTNRLSLEKNSFNTFSLITRCDFVAYGQGMQKTLQRFFM